MESDDLQRELDRVWSRVTGPSAEPPAPPPSPFAPSGPGPGAFDSSSYAFADSPTITREVSLEAISLLKKQQRAELGRLQQLAEMKERSLRELQQRHAAAEAELERLRRRDQRHEETLYEEVFKASQELEAAQKAIEAERARFAEEEGVLRSIAENTRKQCAAEVQRWKELERQWNEREAEYLLQLRELETRARRVQEESARKDAESRKARGELGEAKDAIEKTLSELLQERRDRETADQERDKALRRVSEVEAHVKELQNLWQEERAQWSELWDRERSSWENQRREFQAFEDRVRKQREDFHENLQRMEDRETQFADQMSEMLRRAGQAGEKLNSFLLQAAGKAKEAASTRKKAAVETARLRWRQIVSAGAAAALLAAAYPVWMHLNRFKIELVSSHELDAVSPTGMDFEGDALWVSEWSGELQQLDPADPARLLSRTAVKAKPPYHPVSVEIWADSLYSADSAQARILRHPLLTPQTVSAAWPSPGPAPVALAHDGQNLWSYDAATRLLYRHLGEGEAAENEAYTLGLDVVPSAMRWLDGRLWVFDAKAKRLLVMVREGRGMKLVESAPLEASAKSLVAVRRSDAGGRQRLEVWLLDAPSTGVPTVKVYRTNR